MFLSKSMILLGAASLLFSVQSVSAATLDFSDMNTPEESIIIDERVGLEWNSVSPLGGHLYLTSPTKDVWDSTSGATVTASMSFTASQDVFALDLHGHFMSDLTETYSHSMDSESVTISAYQSDGTFLWSGAADLTNDAYNDYKMENWLTVYLGDSGQGVFGVDYLTFTINKYSMPSIDNLVLEPSPVPLPGALWLLGSGLLGMLTIRKKRQNIN